MTARKLGPRSPRIVDPKIVIRQRTEDMIRTIILKRESGGIPAIILNDMDISEGIRCARLRYNDVLRITTEEQFNKLWKVLTGLMRKEVKE